MCTHIKLLEYKSDIYLRFKKSVNEKVKAVKLNKKSD